MNKVMIACFAVVLGACGGISMKCQGSNCGIVGGDGGVTSDMSGPAYGCAGKGGFKPDPNPQSVVWACPGDFAAGVLRQRCAVGYRLCGGQPLYREICAYDNPAWKGWGSFAYELIASDATQNKGTALDPATMTCDWSNKTGRRLFGACGSIAWQYTDAVQGDNCGQIGGFLNACWLAGPDGVFPQNAWRCPAAPGNGDADFELLSNKSGLSGVLCCPN